MLVLKIWRERRPVPARALGAENPVSGTPTGPIKNSLPRGEHVGLKAEDIEKSPWIESGKNVTHDNLQRVVINFSRLANKPIGTREKTENNCNHYNKFKEETLFLEFFTFATPEIGELDNQSTRLEVANLVSNRLDRGETVKNHYECQESSQAQKTWCKAASDIWRGSKLRCFLVRVCLVGQVSKDKLRR